MRIGRHINVSKGFVTAPAYAHQLGCEIFQIFLGIPQRIISRPKNIDDLKKFKQKLEKYDLKMVVHGSYTINLCHPSSNSIYKTSVKSLVQDLTATEIIGDRCLGVIIHMGKNISANKISENVALYNYINGLKEALSISPKNTTIILETGASQGTEIASYIEGLSEIYWNLTEDERSRVKFCIDTCHIWATGYDISNSTGVKDFFKKFDDMIGIENIICIHFNDSKTALESCVDRHADLGYGHIGESGLIAVAKFAKRNKIPLITETPLDAVNPKTNRDVTFEEEILKLKNWIA